MKKIRAYITYKEDANGKRACEPCTIELPDFREYAPDYTEENRRDLKKFYAQLADADCSLVFDFELPSPEKNKPMQIELRKVNRPTGKIYYGIWLNGNVQIPYYDTLEEAQTEYDKIVENHKKAVPEFEVIKAENI